MSKPPFSFDGDHSQPPDERGFFAEQQSKRPALTLPAAPQDDAHYHGHRDRLRTRYKDHGDTALADYEILELLLFRLIPAPRHQAYRQGAAGALWNLSRRFRRFPRFAAGSERHRRSGGV